METEIIPLDFEIYASVNKENGRRIITRLIDAAGNDVTIFPAGFDSIPESQFEHDNDEPRLFTKSCRKICDYFSVIYLVHKENGTDLFFGIKRFIDGYNYHRRHQGINRTVPSKLYIR